MDDLITVVRTTANKGRTHVFLGHPLSDLCDKTTVEPGNNYSPGVWTCGISVWVKTNGAFYTPDLTPDENIEWGFAPPTYCPPLIQAAYDTGPHLRVSHLIGYLGTEGAEGVDFCTLSLHAPEAAVDASLYLVVRDVGPAGAKINALQWDEAESTLVVNKSLRLFVESAPLECRVFPADDAYDSPVALLHYPVRLAPGEKWTLYWKTEHGFADRAFASVIPLHRPHSSLSVQNGLRQCAAEWENALPVRVFAPDARIAQVWERSAFHTLAALENGLPRIGVVNYPAFWMRDCVLVLRTLDLIGRSDLARIGCEYLAPLYFSGGFGAESDAPGEGILALVKHAEITNDAAFLRRVFPHIVARVEWLQKMLAATVPLRFVGENRAPSRLNTPGMNLLCLAAENGLIRGRMDWHSPDFYINCWAECGFRCAADAAQKTGNTELAQAWEAEANRLSHSLAAHLLPRYGSNERDAIVTPHPTGALAGHTAALREKFAVQFQKKRLTPDGQRKREPLWTYFEAAQIHNAFLLGLKNEAWVSLNGMLDDGLPWQVSTYTEGKPGGGEFLPFRNGNERRGWLSSDADAGNMPHMWTAAEMLCLIRSLFVRENETGLVLGDGVPDPWLRPGSRWGVQKMPTRWGNVSYTVSVSDTQTHLDYAGPHPFACAFPVDTINTHSES